ncbi:MAG: hypothetical protein IIY21_14800 [Clostridiales bacterium]|jgi:hypothetical protein|nr:hypothetical protein [Clostridiales bacterium]
MIELALVLTVLGASAWVGSRLGKREPEEKTQPISKSSYSEISDQITRLNRYKEDIDELSEMIADIMSCSPGKVMKGITIRVPEADHEYDFLIDGEDETSNLLLDLLENERERLNTSLRQEIRKIS